MTEDDAIAELSDLCAATQYPSLSPENLARILKRWLRYKTWTASTAVRVIDKYAPTEDVFNGRVYKPTKAGTTGATEPAWGVTSLGQTVLDGTVTWVDVGPGAEENYDLIGAANEAWTKKAAIASAEFDTSYGDEKESRHQIYLHCVSMANSFRPLVVA